MSKANLKLCNVINNVLDWIWACCLPIKLLIETPLEPIRSKHVRYKMCQRFNLQTTMVLVLLKICWVFHDNSLLFYILHISPPIPHTYFKPRKYGATWPHQTNQKWHSILVVIGHLKTADTDTHLGGLVDILPRDHAQHEGKTAGPYLTQGDHTQIL